MRFSLLAFVSTALASFPAPLTLKVLPLGDSITFGSGSSGGNGYRFDLQNRLSQAGINIEYVGSQHNGPWSNNANEGYPMATIEMINDHYLLSGAYDLQPDIILLHAGTNDCQIPGTNHDVMEDHYLQLLADVIGYAPNATVVVASLIPNLNHKIDACIQHFNARLTKKIIPRYLHTGPRLRHVDMWASVPAVESEYIDITHPNDNGYANMAAVWHRGILAALQQCSNDDSCDTIV